MKKVLFFLLCVSCVAHAQDIIITKDGDPMKVYKLDVASETVFFQTSEAADAPIQRMAKADILMIKFQDGRKLIMGEEGQSQLSGQLQAPVQGESQSTPKQDVSDPTANAQVLQRYQTPVEYVGESSTSKANLVLLTFSPLEGAVMADKNIEIEVSANSGFTHKGKWYEGVSGIWNGVLRVKNKSTKTIYLDLGNSFVIRGTESIPYFIPSVTSSTSGTSHGGTVNLGAVAGAMGIGGAAGTLASGINVGGGNSQSTTTTFIAQRIVPIPPSSTKELGEVQLMNLIAKDNPFPNASLYCNRFKGMAYMRFPKYLQAGQIIDLDPNANSMQFGFLASYAEDEALTNLQSLHVTFGLRRIIGLPQRASGVTNTMETSDIDETLGAVYHNQPYLLLRQKED